MYNYDGLQFASRLFIIGERQIPIKTGISSISALEDVKFFGYRFFIHPKTDLLARYAIFPSKKVLIDEKTNQKLLSEYNLNWKCILSIDKKDIVIDRILTQYNKMADGSWYVDIYSPEDLSLNPHYLIGKMDLLCLSEKDQVLLTV